MPGGRDQELMRSSPRRAAGRPEHAPPSREPAQARGQLLHLQRAAGNAAVGALLAARGRAQGGAAVGEIDAALREVRRDDPVIDTVERGLRTAEASGVPVDLEGTKPSPSALAVTRTGFGPEAVAPPRPPAPTKPVPPVSPLGKAAARPARGAGQASPTIARRPTPAPAAASATPAASSVAPATLTADQVLQPPVPPTSVRPEEDPAFTQVTGGVTRVAHAARAHPSAASKAQEAQHAAVPPSDDRAGQAKAAKVDTMDAQQAGTFDRKAFIAAVKAAIEAKSPKTLKEADEYKESGKAGQVKGEVQGLVGQGTKGQAKDIETATQAAPDQSTAVEKPVTPMTAEEPGQAPAIPTEGAAPKPAPAEQLNLTAGRHQADRELADAGVTEQQLARSNEPQFQQALADKRAAATHADAAPAQYRQAEGEAIDRARTDAAARTAETVTDMHGSKGAALAALMADKGTTKAKDEQKRAEVTAKVQQIYAATEADVTQILAGIDPKVDKEFTDGEAKARRLFEAYVAAKMFVYKRARYGGWLGGLRWAKDELFGMPDEVNEFYAAGRELYLQQMDGVISRVADVVGGDLAKAKQRIAAGKAEITSYVKRLPADLRRIGAEASREIGDRFGQLESDVNAKQQAVVDGLATKYVESRKGLDERITALQEENRGLVDKVIDGVKGVVNTIRELAAMLKNVLSRAAGVVAQILQAPSKFLGNLVAGVKGGIQKFRANIAEHLRKGLLGWLFGSLAEAGVEMPETFDFKGVVQLLASVFGLTWANIRSRIVRKIGEKAMGAAEKGVAIFQTLASQGVAGLWQLLLDKLGNIKDMILERVKDFVITKIITAGITWLLSLLNPAAAFIKACKLIYDIVMFFVNNAERIAKFFNTVIDSMADVVRGNISGVVEKINSALGQMVPILIGFLASFLNLGGVGQKLRQIVQALRKPVTKAIDSVVRTGLRLAGPLIRGLKGISGKAKAKVAAGKAWMKGKVKQGESWVKNKTAVAIGTLRRLKFRAGGESHRLYVEHDSAGIRLMVASTPTLAGDLLRHYDSEIQGMPENGPNRKDNAALQKALQKLIRKAKDQFRGIQGDIEAREPLNDPRARRRLRSFGESLRSLMDCMHDVRMRVASHLLGGLRRYPTAHGFSAGTVKCVATIMVDCASGQRPFPGDTPANTRPRRFVDDPRVIHEIIPEDRVTGCIGGYIPDAPASAEHSEQRLEIATRSTGDGLVSTHAEFRLLSQLMEMTKQDKSWASRVRTIEINLSHSPCPDCARALTTGIHPLLSNEKLRVASVSWTNLWEGKNPTRSRDVKELAEEFLVRGPHP